MEGPSVALSPICTIIPARVFFWLDERAAMLSVIPLAFSNSSGAGFIFNPADIFFSPAYIIIIVNFPPPEPLEFKESLICTCFSSYQAVHQYQPCFPTLNTLYYILLFIDFGSFFGLSIIRMKIICSR
jgi:hypothetical protein